MSEIVFLKDKQNRKIDPTLFSKTADVLAKDLAAENRSNKKSNKRTQIRKFYDEVLRLDMEAKTRPNDWDTILSLVHMLVAKAAYAKGRELVSERFLEFIKSFFKKFM